MDARYRLAVGIADPESVLATVEPCFESDLDAVREAAIETAALVTERDPSLTPRVVRALLDVTDEGARFSDAELLALRDIGRRRPRSLTPLLTRLGPVLSDPRESLVDASTVAAVLGDIGTVAPGVVKPLLGTLLAVPAEASGLLAREAAWAFVRVGKAEPATVRPLVAGHVWSLREPDPTVVATALERLGVVCLLLPDLVPAVDRIAAHLDHPSTTVRGAAAGALGNLAGRQMEDGAPLGVPAPERVAPHVDEVVDLLSDADPDVRHRAAKTVEQMASVDPSLLADHVDAVLQVTTDTEEPIRVAGLDTLTALVEHGVDVDSRQVIEMVGPSLGRDGVELQRASVETLLALAGSLVEEEPETASEIADLLVWAGFEALRQGASYSEFRDGQLPYALVDRLDETYVDICDPGRHVEVARRLFAIGNGDGDPTRQTDLALGALRIDQGDTRIDQRDTGSSVSLEDLAPDDEVADNLDLQEYAVDLLGLLALHSESHRWQAIRELQSLLGHEDALVREAVMEWFCELVEETPELARPLASLARTVFAYQPTLRTRETIAVLTAAADHHSGPVRRAIADLEKFLTESDTSITSVGVRDDDDEGDGIDFGQFVTDSDEDETGGDSTSETADAVGQGGALDRFSTAIPELVGDIGPSLVDLLTETDTPLPVARALARVAATDEGLTRDQCRTLSTVLQDGSLWAESRVWLAAALRCGADEESIREDARERLLAIVAADAGTEVRGSLQLLESREPSLLGRVAGTRRSLSLPGESELEWPEELLGSHPALSLCRPPLLTVPLDPGTHPAADRTSDWLGADDWLSILCSDSPHTVTASRWLRDGPWTGDEDLTRPVLAAIGDERALGSPNVSVWESHPVGDLGAVAGTLSAESATPHEECAPEWTVPAAATAETVDELASELASADPAVCHAACSRLVSVAVADDELRPLVCQHLLAATVGFDEIADRDALLGALSTLAPRDGVRSGDDPSVAPPVSDASREAAEAVGGSLVSLLPWYATADEALVRATAVVAMRALPEAAIDSHVTGAVIDRLTDPDPMVRERAAGTVAFVAAADADVVRVAVEPLVDCLDGPELCAGSACRALAVCGVVEPAVADRVATALGNLLAETDDERLRGAVVGLSLLASVRPQAVEPLADRLVALLGQYRHDDQLRPPLVRTLSRLPGEVVDCPRETVRHLVQLLAVTEDDDVSMATGSLLDRLVRDDPDRVQVVFEWLTEGKLEQFSDDLVLSEFDDAELEPSTLSLYWLFTVLGRLARDDSEVLRSFEDLIGRSVESVNEPYSFETSLGEEREEWGVTITGLKRVTASVAALAGHPAYGSLFEAAADERDLSPVIDPADAAHYLRVASASKRAAVVDGMVEELTADRRCAVLDALFETSVDEEGSTGLVAAIGELLPTVEDTDIHRRGIGALLECRTSDDPETRKEVLVQLGTLADAGVVPADEAVCHTLPSLGDDDGQVRQTAVVSVADLLEAATLDASRVVSMAAGWIRSADGAVTRQSGHVLLVGRLGVTQPACRSRAVSVLAECLGEATLAVQERAVVALSEVVEVDPEAVVPHRDRLVDCRAAGDSSVAPVVDEILSKVESVDVSEADR